MEPQLPLCNHLHRLQLQGSAGEMWAVIPGVGAVRCSQAAGTNPPPPSRTLCALAFLSCAQGCAGKKQSIGGGRHAWPCAGGHQVGSPGVGTAE